MNVVFDFIGVVFVIVVILFIGVYGLCIFWMIGDFFVVFCMVCLVWNVLVISGEYFLVGIFFGLFGFVLLDGVCGFWFLIGYVVGYFLVFVFVVVLLCCSGVYMIFDFMEVWLELVMVWRVISIVVFVIGWLYIVL